MVQLKRKPKVTLKRKAEVAPFSFEEELQVKLLWETDNDLDLCLFFKKKDGAVGGVFSDGFRQNKSDLGSKDSFPFILHSGDVKARTEGGEKQEIITVYNLSEIDTAYICFINYDKAVEGEDCDFAKDNGRIELTADTGDYLEVKADEGKIGQVFLVATIEAGEGNNKLANVNKVLSLDEAFEEIPGFSLICE